MQFFCTSIITAVILLKSVVPNLIHQSQRSDICSKHGSYINGSIDSADGCFTVIAASNCTYGMLKWNDSTIPYGQNIGLHLNAFVANKNGSFPTFALNITISEPLQNQLWFMFEDFIKPQNVKCFNLTKNIISKPSCDNVIVNYDCYVRDPASSLMTSDSYTTIKFIFKGEKMQYKFRNLDGRDMSNGTVFFYTHTLFENQLVITFQALAGISNYVINLCYKGQHICSNTFKVNILENSTFFERYADLITYKISQSTLREGKYELYIECQCTSNKISPNVTCCNKSKIFDIDIDHHFDLIDLAILIGLIMLLGSFTLVIVVFYLRRRVLEPIPGNFKMLLVFDSVSVQHTEYVKATRIFLRKLLKIEVIVDAVDMPNTEQTSPSNWNTTAIEQADCVAIVIPPKIVTCEHRGSPYHRTYQLCLNALEFHFEILLKTNQTDKIITLVLPFSDIELMPKFAKFMPNFKMPVDYFFLRQHIQSIRIPRRIRLPRWLLFNQTTSSNKLFSSVVDNVQKDSTDIHLSDVECNNVLAADDSENNLLHEEISAIHRKKEELDAMYGNNVTSVRNLPSVMSSTNCSIND